MVSVKIDLPSESKLHEAVHDMLRNKIEAIRCPVHHDRARLKGSQIEACCDALVREVRKALGK